ncbi:HlyD family type I secretion periplasmic adaptor subunit [Rhizobium leguminosarum]|uniref:HlyD family type I secretion periplasmic adaptor subunit n=1 Tax=Rhizobium leguminosarum TaxID=384 RepID=UPI001030BDCB|nr:HlyD family type I secretion periplasmic adaptor subunit [Rhizobium leguminosarum]TAU55582.1 HlyD family type I secretion periplasmic adaptor subunit [Rhizobium leguminosarum]
MNGETRKGLQKSLRSHMLFGVSAVISIFGGFAVWAGNTTLATAVVAPGTLVVDGNIKPVQHPSGGIVTEILVREGQVVHSDEVLIRLDATAAKMNYGILKAAINQLYARKARLFAESTGLQDIVVPSELALRIAPDKIDGVMESERRIFQSRRDAREGQRQQLGEQITQYQEQIKGLETQQAAKAQEIRLIDKELEGTRRLYNQGLVSLNRLNSLDRSEARIQGENGQLVASAASAKARISEIKIQLLQIDQDLRSQVETEQRDVQSRLDELTEKEVTARDQLNRVEIRAPTAGTIHDLNIHSVGAVVTPAETLLQIVPSQSKLVVSVKLAPSMIDQVAVGQSAFLKFTAFDRNTTPDLIGQVVRVSADLEMDPKANTAFYKCDIAISADEVAKLRELKLLPGMPVESFIRGNDRSVASYFTKPIRDHMARVFVER